MYKRQLQRIGAELQIYAFHFEQLGVLLGQRVLRLGKNPVSSTHLDVYKRQSQAFTQAETADTTLGQALGSERDAHPGLSGILTLAAARDAFAARMLMVDAAERSVDVQYYICLLYTSRCV